MIRVKEMQFIYKRIPSHTRSPAQVLQHETSRARDLQIHELQCERGWEGSLVQQPQEVQEPL